MVGPEERERTLARLRELCLALPETSERLSHGAPTFFVRGKRAFLMVLTNYHEDGRFARDELAGIAEDAYADAAPARLVDAARRAAATE
jgi:hypothetical protein